MPRTKLGTRESRSWASPDHAGPPVTTALLIVSNGSAGTVRPPISTPSDETSCVSIGFVSIAITRPHVGHFNVAASVPSPGISRSANAICWSHSTQRNFIPDAWRGVEGYARNHRRIELSREVITSRPRKLRSHHVFDDAEQVRTPPACGAHGTADGIARFRGGNRHGEHRWRSAENVTQFEVALHSGRQIEEQEVERAPLHIAQKLPQGRGLHGTAPHEAFGGWPREREGSTIGQKVSHGHAFHAVEADGGSSGLRRRLQQSGNRGPIEVGIQHTNRPTAPRQ